MKREFLTELGLEKEAIEKIMKEHGSTVQEVKTKLKETEQNVTNLTGQLEERNKDIEALKQSASTSEELKTQLNEWQTKYNNAAEAHKTELLQTKKDSAIEVALMGAKARNLVSVKALLDADKIELGEDGKAKGLDEQLQAIQKDNPFLFEVEEQKPNKTPQIVVGGNPSTGDGKGEKTWRDAIKENYQSIKR